jgi:hypothetical protein
MTSPFHSLPCARSVAAAHLGLVRPRAAHSVTNLDLLYLALIAIALLLDHFVIWRGFLRRSQIEPSRAKLWLWSRWMILLWILVAVGILLWVLERRSWDTLMLNLPQGVATMECDRSGAGTCNLLCPKCLQIGAKQSPAADNNSEPGDGKNVATHAI